MLAGVSGAQAQNYPTRTVTIIVPFAAGGPADVMGRIAADIFSRHLGQSFVILPDVPTSYEQGFPQFDCAPFYGLFAPKGTPKAVVDKLAAALSKGLDEPAVQKRLTDLGAQIAEPDQRGPKALGELVHNEIARLAPILKAAGTKSP